MSSLLRSWKTTVAALVTAVFSFIIFAPEHFQQWPVLISFAKFAAAGGMIVFGIYAKDRDVSGR